MWPHLVLTHVCPSSSYNPFNLGHLPSHPPPPQARLVAIIASQRLGRPQGEVEGYLDTLATLLPDIGGWGCGVGGWKELCV